MKQKSYRKEINEVIKLLQEETTHIYWGNCRKFRVGTAYVVGNSVYLPRHYEPTFKMLTVFAHELMHIRQYNENKHFGVDGKQDIQAILECEYDAEKGMFKYLIKTGIEFNHKDIIIRANKYMEYHKYLNIHQDCKWYHTYSDLPLKVPTTWMSKKRLFKEISSYNYDIIHTENILRKKIAAT